MKRETFRRPGRVTVDVVAVCTASTPGNRRGELELVSALRDLGVTVAVASTDYGIVGRLRKSQNLIDLTGAASNSLSVTRALRTVTPRAFIYGTAGAALLEPSVRLARAGIRFDALAADNRSGHRHACQRALERRMVAEAALLLPQGPPSTWPAPARGHRRTPISLPIPVEPHGPEPNAREPAVVCYAAAPEKKRLDLLIGGWERAELSPPYHLVVTGINGDDGRAWLARRGIREPERVTWTGHLSAHEYRSLTATAAIFLSASRYEDYGIAQLEALADGTLLVTAPTPGPYEALSLARSLARRLVSQDMSADGLAQALRSASDLSETDRAHYRESARARLVPYSRHAFRQRLQDHVLPVLLN